MTAVGRGQPTRFPPARRVGQAGPLSTASLVATVQDDTQGESHDVGEQGGSPRIVGASRTQLAVELKARYEQGPPFAHPGRNHGLFLRIRSRRPHGSRRQLAGTRAPGLHASSTPAEQQHAALRTPPGVCSPK